MNRNKLAFSLVEILVALIIISVIMAALAPVITKKLSSAGIIIAGGGSGSIGSSIATGANCPIANCVACSENICITCQSGYQVNSDATACELIPSITPTTGANACGIANCTSCLSNKCIECADGYYVKTDGIACIAEAILDVNSLVNHPYSNSCSSFANCALCSTSACVVCQNGYNLVSGACSAEAAVTHPITTSCTDIDEKCTSCTDSACLTCAENYVLDGGICKEKFRYGEPEKQEDCDPYNAVFVPKKFNGTGSMAANYCVTKYNVAQGSGSESPPFNPLVGRQNGRLMNSQETATGYQGYECFVGPTADRYTKDGTQDSIQGGKYRTVCGLYAISLSCHSWKKLGSQWQALHKSVVDGWISQYSSSTELQDIITKLNFCTKDALSDKIQCYDTGGIRCLGVTNNTCYPYLNLAVNGETAYLFELTNSLGYTYTNADVNMMVSGRCMSKYVLLR